MLHQSSARSASTELSAWLVFLFTLASGAAVGNLYWAQPLLGNIAESYHISVGAAGAVITATQIGYAIGVFLVVPLGDVINRRRLIPGLMFCSAMALVASAVAPNFTLLVGSLAMVGFTTVTGQLLVPLAGDLAHPSHRGRIVGIVVSGILTGILLSRTISGLLGDIFGWRSIYWVAAILSVFIAALLVKFLPKDQARLRIKYRELLSSVIGVIRRYRTVRVTLILGATSFSVFTMFWTGLTFLLSAPPFSYSLTQIGLVGLAGLVGAMGAQRSGVLHDKGWSVRATGAGLLLSCVSLILAAVGVQSILCILIAVVILDVAIQAVNVLNQLRLFSIDPAARSRLNTAFVTANFIGGAIGSALAGLLWEIGGWTALMLGSGGLMLFALLVWGIHRETLRI